MIRIKKRMTSGYISESFEDRSELSKKRPIKSLTRKIKKSAGRDQYGTISVRHRGSGAKRLYRQISTLDEIKNDEVTVLRLEYDPNRSANIALVELKNGLKRYIVAQHKLKVGDKIKAADNVEIEPGNRSPLRNLPIGIQICDIQMYPDSKKYIARAAGVSATLMAVDNNYALLKLPSGELRKIHANCFATVGQISNLDHSNIRYGMAGRKRRMGIRPSVRGKVMSPKAHPHGGGEGVNPIGLKYPKTPQGKIAIGKKTRKLKPSDKFIFKRASKKR